MGKYVERSQPVQAQPNKIEKRAAVNPVILPDWGENTVITAQQHSERLNDGTTSPYRDSMSYDSVTPTEMGNLNNNL